MGFWGVPIGIDDRPTDPVDTDRSTVETIHKMIALVRSACLSPEVCRVVNTCLASLPKNHSLSDLARAIYYWIQEHVRFCEDEKLLAQRLGLPIDKELLIDPRVLLSMPQPMGDCDDFSTLAASCLACANVPCKFVAIAADKGLPWKFSHVYVKCFVDGQWMGFDASHGNCLGWEYKDATRLAEWGIN